MAKMKMNPAVASQNAAQYRDRLYYMLHTYHFFKDFPDRAERETGMNQEQNVQLMIKRYQESVEHPYKMKANRELMMLQKVLLRDAYKTAEMGDLQKNCPLDQSYGVKRIEVYDDELKFLNAKQ